MLLSDWARSLHLGLFDEVVAEVFAASTWRISLCVCDL